MRILAVCLLAVSAIAAERSPQLRAPVLGYWFENNELRALWGVPGAARWSDPIALPDGVGDLAIAPGQAWAIARSGEGLVAIGLDGFAAGAARVIEGAAGDADVIAFSPSGSAAVAYSRRTGRVQVIAGDRVAWEGFAVARVIAVNDDATEVAVAGMGVSVMRSGLAPRAVSDQRASAIAFARDGSLLVLAGDELTSIDDAWTRARRSVIARNAGFTGAEEIAVAGAAVFVARWSVDRASGAVTEVESDGRAVGSRLDGAVMTKAGLAGEVR